MKKLSGFLLTVTIGVGSVVLQASCGSSDNNSGCTPQCTGKCGGDDGCKSSCPDRCAVDAKVCNQSTFQCEACTSKTCSELSLECGPATDNCGKSIECPGCTSPKICQSNKCVTECVPKSCADQQIECGPATDTCGTNIECPACTDPKTCQSGKCKDPCVPKSCADQQIECGPATDTCGTNIECPACTDPKTCQSGKCKEPCYPKSCTDQQIECGPATDTCGTNIDCTACTGGKYCAVGKCTETVGTGKPGPCQFTLVKATVKSTAVDNYNFPVLVYVPTATGNYQAPFPVVVFAHGFLLEGTDTEAAVSTKYQTLVEHLASYCYLTVVANYKSWRGLLSFAKWHEFFMKETYDTVAWVLAESLPELVGKVDKNAVGLVGHSVGGKVSIWAAIEHSAQIQAIVGLDPVDSAKQNGFEIGPSVTPEKMTGLKAPIALLGETSSAADCAPTEDNYQQYYSAVPSDVASVEITFNRAFHMSWVDDPACANICTACKANPNASHDEVKALTRKITVAWLERYLRNNTAMETYLWGPEMQKDVTSGAVTFQKK